MVTTVTSFLRLDRSPLVAAVVVSFVVLLILVVGIPMVIRDDAQTTSENAGDTLTKAPLGKKMVATSSRTSSAAASAIKPASGAALSRADLTARIDPSVVFIKIANDEGVAIGSGFIIDTNGMLATNRHVVEFDGELTVMLPDNSLALTAKKTYVHPTLDLALLKITTSDALPPPIPLSQELPRKGDDIAVFGSPEGLFFTTSFGNISALREDGQAHWLQFTAPVSPGSSGGPMVNMHGEVVGITTMQYGGQRAQNLNFALSAIDIARVLERLKSAGAIP